MGNHASRAGRESFRRRSGADEVEAFCKPTGLYEDCAWDVRVVRRAILNGKLAPRLQGRESEDSGGQECPICFFYYDKVNTTGCCRQPICTECYLQVHPPKEDRACPFCTRDKFHAAFVPGLNNGAAEEAGVGPEAEKDTPPAAEEEQSPAPEVPPAAAATVSAAARQTLEERVRAQTPAPAHGTLTDHNPPTRLDPGDGIAALLQRIGATGRDVRRMEEMMLLEAMRQSMQEAQDADDGAAEGGAAAGAGHPMGEARGPRAMAEEQGDSDVSDIASPQRDRGHDAVEDGVPSRRSGRGFRSRERRSQRAQRRAREAAARLLDEERQIAAAIALSLQEAEGASATSDAATEVGDDAMNAEAKKDAEDAAAASAEAGPRREAQDAGLGALDEETKTADAAGPRGSAVASSAFASPRRSVGGLPEGVSDAETAGLSDPPSPPQQSLASPGTFPEEDEEEEEEEVVVDFRAIHPMAHGASPKLGSGSFVGAGAIDSGAVARAGAEERKQRTASLGEKLFRSGREGPRKAQAIP